MGKNLAPQNTEVTDPAKTLYENSAGLVGLVSSDSRPKSATKSPNEDEYDPILADSPRIDQNRTLANFNRNSNPYLPHAQKFVAMRRS